MQVIGHETRTRRGGAGGNFQAVTMPAIAFTFTLVALVELGFQPSALAQVPGPELFAKEPQTPLELWDAVDYLLRTDQPKKAAPYLDKFLKSRFNDATLITIRNRYGLASILRLSDDAATRPFAKPLVDAMITATRKYATRPERISELITELTRTPPEQDYAVRHLREAGPDAVPFLIEALSRPDLSVNDRRLMVHNIGRLDHSAVPPLIAVLDSPDATLAADAATALGKIGDTHAIPHLTFPAAFTATPRAVRDAAQAAIADLTGRPFPAQPRTPTQVLTAAAWSYHRHQVEFPGDPVVVWTWDKDHRVPLPRQVPRTQAEATFGLRLAQEALRLSPGDHEARVVQLSLALEKAVERVGFESFPANDQATFTSATASGPSILADVLKTAVADGKTDLAASAAMALARVTNPTTLSSTGQPHPLVDALYAPGRRVQFAAARSLVDLAPIRAFPGSSRVVPTLARFVISQAPPRAVVIDGNPNRGSHLAGFLTNLGYDSELELTGDQGFRAAAESAGVELMLISYDLFREGWGLNDTLANLKADARTAAIPVFIYGPLDLKIKRPSLEQDYPGIRFLVHPVDTNMLKRQLKGLPAALSEAERSSYAREAVMLLARIAQEHKGPLVADLTTAEPVLAVALSSAATAPMAATALGNIPVPDAQRSLANLALDPSGDSKLRKQATAELIHNIRQFGPLITASQEARLVTAIREETDLNVREDLLAIHRALRPVLRAGSTRSSRVPVPAGSPAPGQPSPQPLPAPARPGAN
jgi:HEAT repeat protein